MNECHIFIKKYIRSSVMIVTCEALVSITDLCRTYVTFHTIKIM